MRFSTIEYSEDFGSFELEKIAIFNEKNISQDDVLAAIHAGDYNPNIIIVTKEQWKNVFE